MISIDTHKIQLEISSSFQKCDIIIDNMTPDDMQILVQKYATDRVMLITDNVVYDLYKEFINKIALDQDQIIISHGEQSKNFEYLGRLVNMILDKGIDRKTTIIAFGGGVVGDLVGFLASITLRGLKFIQIPTTLLAQVDSSVGGKNGINTNHGKNLVGTIVQPSTVLINTHFIQSLSKRDYFAGIAESFKKAIIFDQDFYKFLVNNTEIIDKREPQTIHHIISKSCELKAKIIYEDEKEDNRRALLNLGHTFAHVFEGAVNYDPEILRHGEAVVLGMICAAMTSLRLGLCSQEFKNQVCYDIQKIFSHIKFKTNLDTAKLLDIMSHDKKFTHNEFNLILPHEFEDVRLVKNVSRDLIGDILDEFLGRKPNKDQNT